MRIEGKMIRPGNVMVTPASDRAAREGWSTPSLKAVAASSAEFNLNFSTDADVQS
jgi:hypothetical protein